jgi:hypothetical protein
MTVRLQPHNVEVNKMEDHRCRMEVSAIEDCRCNNLLDSATTKTEDPRYKGLHRRLEIEVEDFRCNRVVMKMEDPRCKGLSLMW